MNEIYLDRRFEFHVPTSGLFKGITMVVDGTDVPIERPSFSKLERRVYFSGRKKENARSKYNLKYTVAVQISSGFIVFISGPDAGSKTDVRAIRESELISEIIDLDATELVLADKGYQGLPNILTPFKNATGDEEAFNQVISSARQIVECTFSRLKNFGILGERGRFRNGSLEMSIEKHKKIFNICAQITNISFEREPLWHTENKYLHMHDDDPT